MIAVVLIKYIVLAYNGFKTRKALFKANVYCYLVFLVVVLVIEYKAQIFAA